MIVSRTESGYKIVIHVNEKALGKSAVKQMLQSLLVPVGENPV